MSKKGHASYIAKEKTTGITPLPKELPKRKRYAMQVPAKTRLARLVPSTLPCLNVMFANADQLTSSKKVELMKRIEKEKPLVIAICEIKPKNIKERDIQDYTIPDYFIYPVKLDPNGTTGRGLAVYTHKSIDKSTIQIQPEHDFEEACLLEIRLRGCFYQSPTPTINSEGNNEKLNSLLRSVSRKKYSHTSFLGDFNYRDINWETCATPHNEGSKEAKFLETIQDCFPHQHIREPTRKRGNDEASLLDLILTDEFMQVSDIAHHATLSKSDHSVITFKFNCYLDYTKPKERYSYDKADFQAMRSHLVETKWEEELLGTAYAKNCEDLWISLKSKIYDLRNKFVPKMTTSVKPSRSKKGSVPINKNLKEAIRQKNSTHRRWMSEGTRTDSHSARVDYNKARNKVKRKTRQANDNTKMELGFKQRAIQRPFGRTCERN